MRNFIYAAALIAVSVASCSPLLEASPYPSGYEAKLINLGKAECDYRRLPNLLSRLYFQVDRNFSFNSQGITWLDRFSLPQLNQKEKQALTACKFKDFRLEQARLLLLAKVQES